RKTCCHSGGSITFDQEGNLWLSTGDNTSSKESNGYTPIDTRPGRGPYDAQKSSANTNDLRGKILRITPNDYGSYDVPDGNLFPKDGSQGRPEIFVMGARNPFRIAVDQRGYVYWGDVGPDAGQDGRYGPQSYDEWNQARNPGFFGWPYFMGNNIQFPFRDFETDTVGPLFNPAQPINYSPNNTGKRALPPAQPAFIWYPKAKSPEFPMLAEGSNSAMAGPIYQVPATAANSEVKLPAYYEGKWFIYEWARSYIKLVTMNEAGDLIKIEPFMPEEKLVKPIELEVGPDGALYMLEYGANYFMNNPKARLSRIEYAAANRLPVPSLQADAQAGAAPFTVAFSATGSMDFDEDTL
ncbi:MAG: PQQ-dependent sugar dehydrogenase, partial [Bacteroidota bacterium]